MTLTTSLITGYAAGLLGGALYLWLLWRYVGVAVARRATPGRVVLIAFTRIIAALAVVVVAARLGAGAAALIAGLLGFFTARVIATTAARRAARVLE